MSEQEIEDCLRECCQEADVTLVSVTFRAVAVGWTIEFDNESITVPVGYSCVFHLRCELGEKRHVFSYHPDQEEGLRTLIRNTVFDWTSRREHGE